ncbi:MAG: SDR family oxidoreductase [Aureliella sp.]
MSLFIVGCGYVGRQVARLWQRDGNSVVALTRGGDSIAQLEQAGIAPLVADWLDEQANWSLPRARQALVAVPHRVDERFGVQTYSVGLANVLKRLPALDRLVVLSTTGVYHQSDGQWVDESSPTEPTRPGPQMALAAEQWLAEHVPADRATVLRLAGIYGPGRIPLLAKLRQREPLPVAEGDLNLIHVDDAAEAIVQLLKRPAPHRLYVLSDGHPVARRTFYEDAARIFQTPPPVFVAPEPGSSRAGRGESNKRIDSQRILRDLGLRLRYPDHVSGLSAIAAGEKDF